MPTIQHQLNINASKAAVRQAIGTVDGIASWWTRTTEGSAAMGEQLAFHFGPHVTHARVTTADDDHVGWTVEESNPDWTDTRIGFDLTEQDGVVCVRFTHSDWREQNDFFGHCSMKWATFLLSLRDHVERGQGRPFPDDVAI